MHSETVTANVIDPVKVAERFLRPTARKISNGRNQLSGERFWVDGPVGRIAVTRLGQGPRVMLVHGWEGRPADLQTFVPGLIAAGYVDYAILKDPGVVDVAVEFMAHGYNKIA